MTSPAADAGAPDSSVPHDPGVPIAPAGRAGPAGPTDKDGTGTPVDPRATISSGRVTVRRAPRIGRFVVLGAGLGAIATFILTALFKVDPLVGFGALFGYFLLFGVPIGASVGAIFAITFDAIATRRGKQLDAQRESVDAPEEQLEGDLEN